MDVLDEKKLQAAAIAVVDHAAEQLEGILATAILDLEQVLAAQDGWTLEIGPVTIPAIKIRLTGPEKEQK